MPIQTLIVFGLILAGIYTTLHLASKIDNTALGSMGTVLLYCGMVYIVIDFFIVMFVQTDIPHNVNAGICLVIAFAIQIFAMLVNINSQPEAQKRKNAEF